MVTGVETFGKAMERAVAGDNAALLLRGVRRHQVRRTAAPGDQITVTVELGQPVALEPGLGFALREGGRTVGAGTVGTLLD